MIVVIGLVVCYGMAGCLGLIVLVGGILGRLPLETWLVVSLSVVWLRILGILLLFGPHLWDVGDIALEVSDTPNIWTDGSREDFSSVGGFEVAGAGVYVPASELAFEGSISGVAEEYGDARLERCRAFLPVPGPLQTVQRAEFWGAITALQAYWPCHLGIDNLNVARSIGRLLVRGCLVKPLPSIKDGDLVALVQYMIQARE